MLRLCYSTGISIIDYLSGSISGGQNAGSSKPEIMKSFNVNSASEKKRSRRIDWIPVEKLIKESLREYPPPPVKEIVRRSGYFAPQFYYHFRPMLVKVVARYTKYIAGERRKIERLLLSELDRKEGPPLPLSKVVRLPDGKSHYLAYTNWFPDICEKLKIKYEKYKVTVKTEKKEMIVEDVRRAAVELHSKGVYPSAPKVAALLTKASYMTYEFARSALREIQNELGERKFAIKYHRR
jgi:hypothetical protein